MADLECAHTQHVRHDPPWQDRPWVLDEAQRRARLGTMLDCVRCDEGAGPGAPPDSRANLPPHFSDEAVGAYWDARLQGLCHEGALEVAEGMDRGERRPRG